MLLQKFLHSLFVLTDLPIVPLDLLLVVFARVLETVELGAQRSDLLGGEFAEVLFFARVLHFAKDTAGVADRAARSTATYKMMRRIKSSVKNGWRTLISDGPSLLRNILTCQS